MTYYELTREEVILPSTNEVSLHSTSNYELTDQELSQVSGGFIELYPWWREGWV